MSYELYFDKAPTGRTHQVNNGGTMQTQEILGADGEPEQEFVLGAIVDGHRVPLQTYSIGYVEHMASRPDTAIDDGSTASSPPPTGEPAPAGEPASPAAGEGVAGEGAAQQTQPPDGPTG